MIYPNVLAHNLRILSSQHAYRHKSLHSKTKCIIDKDMHLVTHTTEPFTMKNDIIKIQQKIGVTADGIIGPRTVQALTRELGIASTHIPQWPTQAEIRRGTSCFGRPGNESVLTSIVPPYPLLYEGKPVRSIRVHELVAPHVQMILRDVLEHYGLAEIQRLGLDLYGGSYNYRSSSSGASLSMHAWGIALDFSPMANAYHTKAPRATLSHRDCQAWWEIWEQHGAVSLGRSCNFDWMHVQFASLN